uniref:Negative elongation factor E n=2 Tax=Timema TaxID=61471 RepID=A0A7R9FY13_TIMSH|nr:unnamed protein product [Timema shepardi]CAD7569494.1 unnamed protein product [Timema californicum]
MSITVNLFKPHCYQHHPLRPGVSLNHPLKRREPALLKKKSHSGKKALQALKAPRPEPERTPQTPKRPAEARDAREVAKKLLKSGAITAITKTPKRQEQAGFKRPRGLERKLSSAERTVSGYQPFSATHPEDMETDNRPKVKNLYESFVSARDREERGLTEKREGRPDKPRQGNTIFVSGHKITEEFLRKAFHSCGHIVNVTMEIEKHRGFVTFDKVEVADRAITELLAIHRREAIKIRENQWYMMKIYLRNHNDDMQ